MSKIIPLVIYHGSCADGFASVWLANKAYFDKNSVHSSLENPSHWYIDTHAATYGDPPPNVTDRVVYILDFSYPKEQMEKIANYAQFVTVIDHHESAIRKLDGF